MDPLRRCIKVKKTPVVGKNVKLLMEYINKDKEQQMQLDKKEGINVNAENYNPKSELIIPCIQDFVRYRNSKMDYAYKNRIKPYEGKTEDIRSYKVSESSVKLAHENALGSLNILVRFASNNGLTPIYTGDLLTDEEINEHKLSDTLINMTNAILELLYALEGYSFQENEKSSNKELIQIQKDMLSFDNVRNISEPLTKYGGTITYNDSGNIIK